MNSAERAEVVVKVENQLRPAVPGQLFVPLDLRICAVDDYFQTTDGGSCCGYYPLDYRDAFDFEPCLVPIHSRAKPAGLNKPIDVGFWILDCGLLSCVH